MYTVAYYSDLENKNFSVTCRDLEKSKHWKRISDNKIFDSSSSQKRIYTIFSVDKQNSAKKTKVRLEDTFTLSGFKKIPVKD